MSSSPLFRLVPEEPRSPFDHLFDAYNEQRRAPPPGRKGLLGFFRKGPKAEEKRPVPAAGGDTVVAATNAPARWPPVRIPATVPPEPGMARALVEAAVVGALSGWDGPARLRRLAATRLHPGGVVWAPAVVEDEGGQRLVFVYPRSDADAAGHFAGVRRALRELGEAEPVYYAHRPLPDAAPADPFSPFGAMAFRTDASPSAEPRAAWWATEDDPDFAASETFRSMDRAVRALDGVHSYVFAAWLREHAPGTPMASRVALPQGGHTLTLHGPEEVSVWFSADAEKGIALHFLQETPRVYRERLWGLFAEYAEGWRGQVEEQGWAKDPPTDPNPLGHWLFFQKMLKAQLAQGMKMHSVRVLHTLPASAARP